MTENGILKESGRITEFVAVLSPLQDLQCCDSARDFVTWESSLHNNRRTDRSDWIRTIQRVITKYMHSSETRF